jgi:hypothetical protein
MVTLQGDMRSVATNIENINRNVDRILMRVWPENGSLK